VNSACQVNCGPSPGGPRGFFLGGKSVSNLVVALTSLLLLAALPGISISAPLPSKVWVANWGVDSSSCGSVTSPCATLQPAHDNVAPGGEIRVLTPGDFGGKRSPRLSITKSVSIIHDGSGEAGIFGALDGPAIYIAAGANDVVSLRGLVIDGQGLASEGIQVRRATAVHIQNCVIRNFGGLGGGVGISLMPAVNSRLFVSDSIIFNNGSSLTAGAITVRPSGSSASANVVLDRVVLEKNIVGLKVDGTSSNGKGVHAIIRDSVVSSNAADGILAISSSGKGPATIILERTASVNNGRNGILADGPRTTALLRDSVITGNDAAMS
jgi:Right handed beta helix region